MSTCPHTKAPRCIMRKRYLPFLTFIAVAVALTFATTNGHSRPKPKAASSKGLLVVANQFEHTALIVDPETRKELAKITIGVIDIANRKLAYSIDLGKPLRPHNPEFGPDGNLYVSAELSQSIDVIDP